MDRNIEEYNGYLITGDKRIEVTLTYASKFSMGVRFIAPLPDSTDYEYEGLILQFNEREFQLSACRILSVEGGDDTYRRLIFQNDIYDFDSLFYNKEIVNLDTLSANMGLIFSQKEKVRDSFKKYSADLVYDLKVYKQFLDTLDSRLSYEESDIQDSVFETILKTEAKNFHYFMAAKLDEMEKAIADFTREEHEAHGFYLRKQLWDILSCSEFMMRTNLKPRGYAGDSEMMRMIYENGYRGESTFAKLLYKFSLDHPASQAVRNRRGMIARILKETGKEFHDAQKSLRFMSVACGPAYELQDLFLAPEDAQAYRCTLLDQDTEALDEAKKGIKKISEKIKNEPDVTYLKDSVRTMLKTRDLTIKWGTYHFIYSMGLFDYLTPPVAKAVIEKIYSLLKPGGRLLIGNYHVQNKSRWFMEYWHDWVLYYRTENDLRELLNNTTAEDIEITFEESKSQMFMTARKPG